MIPKKFQTVLRLTAVSIVIGVICGLGGSLFHFCTEQVDRFRAAHWWLVFLLPLAGLLIVFLYSLCKIPPATGSAPVFEGARKGTKVSPLLAVCIFFATCLTHLFGGSAGREGAALQFGGSLGSEVGSFFKFGRKHNRLAVLCGMAAGFTAMFGTPITAAVFVAEATDLAFGLAYANEFIYIILSTAVAYLLATLTGVHGMRFEIDAINWNAGMILKLTVIALACAALAVLFILGNEHLKKWATRTIKNDYVRIAVGGVLIILLTLLFSRNGDYNGIGSSVIAAAMDGNVRPEAFLLKLIFTVVTLSFGFKGGELVPVFFIGATLGGALGGLLGLPVAFCAAIGMIAIFAAAADCPIAAIVMGAEIFGAKMLPFFLFVCVISYFVSGNIDFYDKKSYKADLAVYSNK